jgi:gas vesicle protein
LLSFDKNSVLHTSAKPEKISILRREPMRRKSRKYRAKRDAGKVITGMLLGSVFGATVALLMAPASGEETRRKITGEAAGVKEKMKTAAGNIETKARELVEDVNDRVSNVKGSMAQRRTTTYSEG